MNRFFALPAAAVIAVTAMSVTASASPSEASEYKTPSVTFDQALAAARGAAEGQMVGLSLEYPFDDPAYFAELESATSESLVVIDGMTGDVLFTNIATANSPETLELMGLLMEAEDDHEEPLSAEDAYELLSGFEAGDEVPVELMLMLEHMDDEDADLLEQLLQQRMKDEGGADHN